MIPPKDPGPGEDYDPAQHPIRNAFFRLLAGVIGIVCLWMLWIDEAAFAKSDFTALGRAVLFIPMGLLFLVFAFGGYAGIEWFYDLIRRRLFKISGETANRKINDLRSDDDFRQLRVSSDLLCEIDAQGHFINLRPEILFLEKFNWGSYSRAVGPMGFEREIRYKSIEGGEERAVSCVIDLEVPALLAQLDSVGVCFYDGVGKMWKECFFLVYVRDGYLVSQAIQEISRVHAAMQADLRASRPLGVVD
jgi:hypothetical protein